MTRIIRDPILSDYIEFDYVTSLSMQEAQERISQAFHYTITPYIEHHVPHLVKCNIERETSDDIICHGEAISVDNQALNRDLTKSAVFLKLIKIDLATGACFFKLQAPILDSVNDIHNNRIRSVKGKLENTLHTPNRVRRLIKALLQNGTLESVDEIFFRKEGKHCLLKAGPQRAAGELRQLMKQLYFEAEQACESFRKYSSEQDILLAERAKQKCLIAEKELKWLLPHSKLEDIIQFSTDKIRELVRGNVVRLLESYAFTPMIIDFDELVTDKNFVERLTKLIQYQARKTLLSRASTIDTLFTASNVSILETKQADKNSLAGA